MYGHIIFDIDGTLIDTERTGVISLIRTVSELTGRDMSYDEAYSYFGIPSAKVGPLLEYPDPKLFEETWEKNFTELMGLMKVFPGIEAMMEQLAEAGRKIGCVTSRNRLEFEKDPELRPLLRHFGVEICFEDTTRHKPDPDPILEYFRRSGAATAETIYVGDTIHDCECAHGAGIPFLLADWRSRGLRGIPADYMAGNTDEMLAVLLRP